jgi:hypothetical protein
MTYMSDAENPEESAIPPGMSEAQIAGGPPPRPGLNAIPLTPPPGGSFTFWAHGDGGTMTPGMGSFPSLYLVYQAEKEDELLAWANGITGYVKGIIYIQRRIRARSIEKAAERAAQHPQQLPPHRPRRVPPSSTPFVPPQPQYPQAEQVQPQQVQPQPQQVQPQPAVHHRPHPTAPTVSPQQISHEAELARARVRSKEQLAQATTLIERFASSPEGAEHLRRVLGEADARRSAMHPPGSPGAAVAAAAGQPMPPPPPPTVQPPDSPPHHPNGTPQ